MLGLSLRSVACAVSLTVYNSLVAFHTRPKADSNLSQISTGRYVYGIVESIYMERVSDIKLVEVVTVETAVGMYVMVLRSARNV